MATARRNFFASVTGQNEPVLYNKAGRYRVAAIDVDNDGSLEVIYISRQSGSMNRTEFAATELTSPVILTSDLQHVDIDRTRAILRFGIDVPVSKVEHPRTRGVYPDVRFRFFRYGAKTYLFYQWALPHLPGSQPWVGEETARIVLTADHRSVEICALR